MLKCIKKIIVLCKILYDKNLLVSRPSWLIANAISQTASKDESDELWTKKNKLIFLKIAQRWECSRRSTSIPATPKATAPTMLPLVLIKSFRAVLQPVRNALKALHPAAPPAQHEFGTDKPHSAALFRPQHCS